MLRGEGDYFTGIPRACRRPVVEQRLPSILSLTAHRYGPSPGEAIEICAMVRGQEKILGHYFPPRMQEAAARKDGGIGGVGSHISSFDGLMGVRLRRALRAHLHGSQGLRS